ncbi:hypothetical protein [Aquibacillus kalidii]|uniref:hypothetical protein n=1 Tax=Aquibacillus kalidii TaxID=2762597 RepID=UPI001645EC5A|nr:hypothetical protein [Aquibacillus kalidii]
MERIIQQDSGLRLFRYIIVVIASVLTFRKISSVESSREKLRQEREREHENDHYKL